MGLLDVRNYLMQVKMASLSTLCHYFNCDSELLRQMLRHWIRKGKVRHCQKTPHCGVKCMQCSPLLTEIYEWIGFVDNAAGRPLASEKVDVTQV